MRGGDAHRDLYLVAYDIREPKRLQTVLKYVAGFASGGQKSVKECFLTPGERDELAAGLAQRMRLSEDRAHVIRLRTNCSVWTLGVGVAPEDPDFYFVGGGTARMKDGKGQG